MVFVAGDQFVDVLQTHLLPLRQLEGVAVEEEAYGRDLVDDEDTLAVGHTHVFFVIGVVGCAVRVGAHPLEQGIVFDQHRQCKAAAEDRKILVLAKSLEKDGLAVEQYLLVGGADRAHAHGQLILINGAALIAYAHSQAVQEGVFGRPQPYVRYRQTGFGRVAAEAQRQRILPALALQQQAACGRRAGFFYPHFYHPLTAFKGGHDRDVFDGGLGRGSVQPHRAVEACIGEKVEIGAGVALEKAARNGPARRHAAGLELVFNADGDAVGSAKSDVAADVKSKRQVAAGMHTHRFAVDPHLGEVVGRAYPQVELLPAPGSRHKGAGLVPGKPQVVAAVGKLLVPAARHRNGAGSGQAQKPLLLLAYPQRVFLKLPHTRQVQGVAGSILLREKRYVFAVG